VSARRDVEERSVGVCRAQMGCISVQHVIFELDLEWEELAVWRRRLFPVGGLG